MLVCSSRKPSARCLSCASMSVMRDLTIDTCHKVTRFGYYPWAATVLLCVTLWSVCLSRIVPWGPLTISRTAGFLIFGKSGSKDQMTLLYSLLLCGLNFKGYEEEGSGNGL